MTEIHPNSYFWHSGWFYTFCSPEGNSLQHFHSRLWIDTSTAKFQIILLLGPRSLVTKTEFQIPIKTYYGHCLNLWLCPVTNHCNNLQWSNFDTTLKQRQIPTSKSILRFQRVPWILLYYCKPSIQHLFCRDKRQPFITEILSWKSIF